METKPLAPDEVGATPTHHPTIIKIVNQLLKQRFDGKQAVIPQSDIVAAFLKEEPNYTRQQVFDEKLLDFEFLFKNVGWKVEYDKPGWNETPYPAVFRFTRR